MRRSLQRYAPLTQPFNLVIWILIVSATGIFAQSPDASYPTPLMSNEIAGRIAPRDIGDARSTSHFYTFTGIEGDLVITVESTDLNGGVDLFTANSLRPLTKITLYAGASETKVTKSIYLRAQEPLVLRVEGRSAGDADAVYRIRFEGAFAPSPNAAAQANEPLAPTLAESSARDPNVKRVNSVGARIDEPASTAAAAAPQTPEMSPTPAAENAQAAAKPVPGRGAAATPTQSRRVRPAARSTARNKTRRPNSPLPAQRRGGPNAEASATGPAGTAPPPARDSNADELSVVAGAASNTTRNSKTARHATNRRPKKNTQPSGQTAAVIVPSESAPSSSAATATAAATSPRLIIVTRNGETLERAMSTVRRVTVENNQIVVVGTDGKVTRQPMANVVRMAIEP